MIAKWRAELPIAVLLLSMFAGGFAASFFANDRIPIHWNLQGEVDGYAGKWEGLMFVPLVSLGMAVLLIVLPKIDPGSANFENFARSWRIMRLAIIGFLLILQVTIIWAATNHPVNMNVVMPLSLGFLFVVLGNYMSKLRPNWTVGVRTPWTLSSRLSWTMTHRYASWQFTLAGVAFASIAIVQNAWYAGAVIAGFLVSVIWLIFYSYLVWRSDPDKISAAAVSPAREPETEDTI